MIGYPPCQPFSVFGSQKGMGDARDGFPIFINAIKQIQSKEFLFENVRSWAYSHKWYFDLIKAGPSKLGYIIDFRCLNAVNYGVPQNRERSSSTVGIPIGFENQGNILLPTKSSKATICGS